MMNSVAPALLQRRSQGDDATPYPVSSSFLVKLINRIPNPFAFKTPGLLITCRDTNRNFQDDGRTLKVMHGYIVKPGKSRFHSKTES